MLCERISYEKIPKTGWAGSSCQKHINECYDNLTIAILFIIKIFQIIKVDKIFIIKPL